MSADGIPGYDAWKLTSPYEGVFECEDCGSILPTDASYCRSCRNGHGDDPDEAYDRMRAERDALPGHADYVPPYNDDDCDF